MSDSTTPLKNARHERFAVLVAGGATQSDAYRQVYPKSLKWTDKAVHNKACAMAGKGEVERRIESLKASITAAAVSLKVLSLLERKEMLSQAARDCFRGVGQFIRVTEDGRQIILVDEETSKSLALKSVKTRRVTSEAGVESTFVECEARDFLPYVEALNKMDGVYREKVEHAGHFVMSNDPELLKAL